MFIAGIAGIENTAFTEPSVNGEPSGCFTVARKLLSPDLGRFGSLRNVTVISPALPVCTDDEPVLDDPPHDEASTASSTTTAGATLRTNHSGRRRRMSSPIANTHGMRNSIEIVELIMPPNV